MKVLNALVPLILVLIAAGCKSHEPQTVSSASMISPQVTETPAPSRDVTASTNTMPQQIVTDKAIYTIKVIPNPRLSATSREGDKTSEVFSSNIIAVYVQPRHGGTANSTNSPAGPSTEGNPQP